MVDRVIDSERQPKGYEQLTSITAATKLTPPADAKVALIQAETADVRWRDDDTAPTASIGMTLAAGDSFLYVGKLHAIQFIQVGAGAILNVSYYA